MQFIMEDFEFEDLDLDNEWLDQLEKDNKKYKDFYTEQVEKIEINYVYMGILRTLIVWSHLRKNLMRLDGMLKVSMAILMRT